MQLFTSLSKWITAETQNRRAPARKATRCFRPQLETLEGRDVPSTLTVTNNLDSGAGSLRADIAAANTGDTINFAPSLNGQTITLTSGQLVINKSLSIQGPGAGELAISGGGHFRVFEVSQTNVMLSGLTITQGSASMGGGIYNTPGSSLTISGCTLSNNHAQQGGGIYNLGAALEIVNSTLSGNKALDENGSGDGGAVYNNMSSNVSITGCTFSNNSATAVGGAVWTHCTLGNTLTITGCSFSGNVEYKSASGWGSYPAGNDIYQYDGAAASTLTVSDSIFSNNTRYHFDPIEGGPWTNEGGNTFNY